MYVTLYRPGSPGEHTQWPHVPAGYQRRFEWVDHGWWCSASVAGGFASLRADKHGSFRVEVNGRDIIHGNVCDTGRGWASPSPAEDVIGCAINAAEWCAMNWRLYLEWLGSDISALGLGAIAARPATDLPADGQWVLALHAGDPRRPFMRWFAGRFNLERMDRDKDRDYLGLSMPGFTEAWRDVIAWTPLPDPGGAAKEETTP